MLRLPKIISLLFSAAFILMASTFAMAESVDDFTAPTSAEIQQRVSDINAAIQQTGGKWVAGETSISKLSPAERRMHLGAAPPGPETPEAISGALYGPEQVLPLSVALPTVLDWRNYYAGGSGLSVQSGNYVTPIRDQGSCGSCFIFGSIAGLESKSLIAMNTPGVNLNLSEEAVLTCDTGDWGGSDPCYCGGYPVTSFFSGTGAPFEYCDPYAEQNYYNYMRKSCSYSYINPNYWTGVDNYKVSSYQWVVPYGQTPTPTTLKNALYNYGPIVVRMVVWDDLDYYRGGVYSHAWTNHTPGGHIVLLVGYDDNNQCFIVKNSWGTGWGEAGFFRIAYSEVGNYYSNNSQFGDTALSYTASPPVVYSSITYLNSYPAINNAVLSKADLGASVCTISGTANTGSTKYMGVYVNTDGGSTFWLAKDASGAGTWSSWTYKWPLPRIDGAYTLKCLVWDGFSQTLTNNPITVTVDNTKPASLITAPTKGSALTGASYPITGTATDNLSGVTGVEVSTDGGKTWKAANITSGSGTTSATWSYCWTLSDGAYTIKSRATDNGMNVEKPIAINAVAVTVPPVVSLNPVTPSGNSIIASASVVDTSCNPVPGMAVLFYVQPNGTTKWMLKSKVLTGADGTCISHAFTLPVGSYQVKAVNTFLGKAITSNMEPVTIDTITSAGEPVTSTGDRESTGWDGGINYLGWSLVKQ